MQSVLLSAVTRGAVVCPPALFHTACMLLSEDGAGRISGAELESLLRQAERGLGTFDHLLVVHNGVTVDGAILGLVQPGRSAFVWPAVTRRADARLATTLLDTLTARLDVADVVFSQALLDPADASADHALASAGFEAQGTVLWLERSLSPHSRGPVFPESNHCGWVGWSEAERDRFLAVFEATQIGSQDCPRIQSVRPAADTFASQLAASGDETDHWRLLRIDGCDAGLCLAVDRPNTQTLELTYFGVVPQFRGQGWGETLIASVLDEARKLGRAAVTAAVRAENTPAMRLYRRLGFHEVRRWGLNLRINPRYSSGPILAQEIRG